VDDVKSLEKEIESVMHGISSKLYSQTQQNTTAEPQTSTKSDDVEDATFEEV
jgi:hypothetical protein